MLTCLRPVPLTALFNNDEHRLNYNLLHLDLKLMKFNVPNSTNWTNLAYTYDRGAGNQNNRAGNGSSILYSRLYLMSFVSVEEGDEICNVMESRNQNNSL